MRGYNRDTPFLWWENPVASINTVSPSPSNAESIGDHSRPGSADHSDGGSLSPRSRSQSVSSPLLSLQHTGTDSLRSRGRISVRPFPAARAGSTVPSAPANDAPSIFAPRPVKASDAVSLQVLGGQRALSPMRLRPAAAHPRMEAESSSIAPDSPPANTPASPHPAGETATRYAPPPEAPPGWKPESDGAQRYTPPPGSPPGWKPESDGAPRYDPPPGPPPGWKPESDGAPRYDPPPGPPPGWKPESDGAPRYDPPPGPPPGFHAHHPGAHPEPLMQEMPLHPGVTSHGQPAEPHWLQQRLPQLVNMGGQIADIALSTLNAFLQILVKAAHKLEELSRK
ncbi:hypothetical protein KDW54_32160 [Burkholderia ambifaria]|uniref:hypothetical protein n=1 Tax=Burkholderia ambifaria TaxID=152480 RepID=UPI001B922196|nr:hypothetical protein [Burkholderia ambifaria]MBR8187055.1 hypothetical protein [Burkholderia ambifaria]